MCGIAGLICRGAEPADPELLAGLLRRLAHRGPDDVGWLTYGASGVSRGREVPQAVAAKVALLHRRLSIIDLSQGGWQPMSTPDGRFHIVQNGEIYNYVELREQLTRSGIRFRSASDTEVLLAAYAMWGSDALPQLVGMFVFAILDSVRNTVVLGRDCFGIKPLYYTQWRDGFAFASEIKALLLLPGVSRQVHPQALYDYLRFGLTDHGPDTLFATIHHVPSGHLLEIPLEGRAEPQARPYWTLAPASRTDLSFPEAAECLRGRFLENIRFHLRSDVPVGVALSGGIDSSSIAMALRHVEPSVELQTFSYVADDASVSEERWIDTVAVAARSRAHKVSPSPEQLLADLDQLITAQDEPFGSTSIYAQYCVFRKAQEAGVKVMLDGQGADELLAGYTGYLAARLGSLLRQGRWGEAARFTRHARRLPHVEPRRFLAKAGSLFLPEGLGKLARRLVGEELAPSWLNTHWFRERDVRIGLPPLRRGREMLRAELVHSVRTGLPSLLRYEDRNSMAFSIESRVPFLTSAFAEIVLSLPEEYLIAPDATSKAVFRAAMRGIVPDSVLDRRDKIGFVTPELRWLGSVSPRVDSILNAGTLLRLPALDPSGVKNEWEGVRQRRLPFSFRVWRWINLLRWAELNCVSFV